MRRLRADAYAVGVAVLLAAGAVVRILAAYPVHKTPGDADSLLTGMCALHVLRGHFPAFLAVGRQGAAECYMAAGAFKVFGVSRASLFGEALLIGTLGMVAAFLFFRELLDRRAAIIALVFIALPSPAILLITYMPVGHSTTFLLMSLIFFLGARVARVGPKPWLLFCWGLAAGLGVWHTFLTLGATVPTALWMLLHDRRVAKLVSIASAAGGVVVGALPWIGYNVIHPLRFFKESVAFGGRPHGAQIFENANYALTRDIVGLLVPRSPTAAAPIVVARFGVYAIYAGAVVYALVNLVRRSGPSVRTILSVCALGVLSIVTAAVILVPTALGSQRGWTVRYMLPVWFVAIPLLAIFVADVGRRVPVVAALMAACVVLVAVTGYEWPGTGARAFRTDALRADAQLVRQLERGDANVAVGTYWSTYPLNFLTREKIRAVPCDPRADYLGYGESLPNPSRWVLVYGSSATQRDWINGFVRRFKLRGTFERAPPVYTVFLASTPLSGEQSRQFLDRAQAAC